MFFASYFVRNEGVFWLLHVSTVPEGSGDNYPERQRCSCDYGHRQRQVNMVRNATKDKALCVFSIFHNPYFLSRYL
jgi:hypothetical protein